MIQKKLNLWYFKDRMISYLENKKILILGFGREGRDSFLFLRRIFPRKILGIADQSEFKNLPEKSQKIIKDKKHLCFIDPHFGNCYLKAIESYDIAIKSPGVPVFLPEIQKAFKRNKITSQTEIFFDNCPGKIVGITGTKGKSTTAFWIYQTLKRGRRNVSLVGNIGKPVLTSLFKAEKNDVFVYELSSHQLYNLKKSPHIAVILNIYPEHLDYYRSFKEYVLAKANIAKYQTGRDYLIYNRQDSLVKKIAQKSRAKKIPIQGKYYKLNEAAAGAVSEIFKIPLPGKFNFLPHRLEYSGRFQGVSFYNDSLSTVPQTTIEALDFLGERVKTLILGGYDRGLDFRGLAERIERGKVKTLILFPTTGEKIRKEIRNKKINCFFVKTMKEAVGLAYKNTEKGGICLLSPASPSFGIFKDYADRGEQFKKFLKMLK